jgi:membrane protein required for colicin V production
VTAFDFVIIAIILLSSVFAFSRGLVREALSIAAWVLAAVIAFYAFPYVLPFVGRYVPKGAVADIVAGAGVFLVALVLLHMIARMLAGRVKSSHLSAVDRTLGLLFGLARGLVLACILYIALAWFLPAGEHRPQWFAESRTLPYLAAGADRLEQYFPRSARPAEPGRSTTEVEQEAEKAIGAFINPAPSQGARANDPPVYSPGEQRDLNRLIQQQNSP